MRLNHCPLIALIILPVMACRGAPRAAFVAGNCAYTSFSKLDNPKQDAAEMSRVLTSLGFAVTRADDLTAVDLKTRIATFSAAHPDAKEILFYFSGHGLQVHGENYLTGTDSTLDITKREAELKKVLSGDDLTRQLETETRREADRTMLSLSSLAGTLEKTGRKDAVRLVILDSCRDNPAGTKSVLGSKGLAKVDAPGGMLIAFAAKEGTTAAQTEAGKPSLYTRELLKIITQPGLTAEQVFKRTRAAVIEVSNGAQEPREYSGLTGELVFLPGGTLPVPPAATAPSPPPAPGPAPAAPALPETYTALAGKRAGDGRLITVAKGVNIPFRWCPPGTFEMGSKQREKDILTAAGRTGDSADEILHSVTLTHGFWLAETELTQLQWESVMKTTVLQQAQKTIRNDTQYTFDGKLDTWRAWAGAAKNADPAKHIGEQAPPVAMYFVSHDEARQWCATASRAVALNGWTFALPTEAQWEYACRAGTSTVTYGGDLTVRGENDAPELDAVSWYAGNSSQFYNGRGWNTAAWPQKQYPGGTAGIRRVAGKKPNAWGFYDMIGNVMEWTGDWYAGYATGSVTDPAGPPSGEVRVYRGGAWNSSAIWCRAANRAGSEPGIRHVNLGFRPALTPVRQ